MQTRECFLTRDRYVLPRVGLLPVEIDTGRAFDDAEDGMLHGRYSVCVGRSIASRHSRKTGRVGDH